MRTCEKILVFVALLGLAVGLACGDDDEEAEAPDAAVDAQADTSEDIGTDTAGDAADDTAAEEEEPVQPEGFFIEGLSAPVTVRIDDVGMPHVTCQTDDDCFAAQGYLQARDRFTQMDRRRRLARGRLATLLGPPALPIDRTVRSWFMTRDGRYLEEAFFDASADTVQAAFEAYTRGVNAWLGDYRAGRNEAALADEYDFALIQADDIPDWEVYDSTACALLLAQDLSMSASADLGRAEAYEGLDPEVIFDLMGQISLTGNSTLGAVGETYEKRARPRDPSGLATALARLEPASDLIDQTLARIRQAEALFRSPGGAGSNNWVIGPSRTTDSTAILANDPHLALTNPALWYPIHLDAVTSGDGDVNVAGVSFAGIPGILLGRNANIAWGATVVGYDLTDVYLETLDETGEKVLFDGGEVDILRVEHSYPVARGEPVVEDLLIVPHHGPVLSYDPENGQAISMRWTGTDIDTDFSAFLGLMTASTVAEAREAAENATTTNQNWVVIDLDNNIGWYPYSRVPIRSWASPEMPPWLPLPGDGTAEWEGFMDYADLPQLTNPTAGFVATANQDATGALADGDPTNDGYNMLQEEAADGMRHQRIVDLILEIDDQHTLERSVEIQGDTLSLFGAGMVPAVLAAVDGATLDDSTARVVAALEDWEYTCPSGLADVAPDAAYDDDEVAARESIGCLAFHALIGPLEKAMFEDELDGSNAGLGRTLRAAYNLLVRPEVMIRGDAYWDDVLTEGTVETEQDIVLEALADTATVLESMAGTDPDDWRWGRFHQLLMTADLINDLGASRYNHGPFAAPGGLSTVNVAHPRGLRPENPDFSYRGGPSMRHVSQVTDDGLRMVLSFPGGVRNFRDSPFYNNLVPDYLANQPFEVRFDAADVEAATVDTIELEPLE